MTARTRAAAGDPADLLTANRARVVVRRHRGCLADAIASQLAAWQRDGVALCEFRATP